MQRLLLIAGIFFGLWVIVYIALRLPPVQDFITGKIAGILEKKIGTPVALEGIDIDWLDAVEITGLYVEDQQQDTLLYLGLLRVEIEPWALLNKTLVVKQLRVQNTYANIYQVEGTDSLNFAYIPEALSSADTTAQPTDTTSSSFTVEARQLLLSNIRTDFVADSTEAHATLGELSLILDKLGLEEQHIRADELSIDQLEVALQLPRTTAPDSTTQTETPPPAPDSLKNVINPSGYAFSLADFSINASQVDYQVGSGKEPTPQLDFENLLIANLGVQIEDIEVGRTNASLNLEQFTFTEQRSGFSLEELALDAAVDMPRVQATLKKLETGHSNLNGKVAVSLSLEDQMADLINSLTFKSELDQAVLSMKDATYFTNALDSMPTLKDATAQLDWQVDIDEGAGGIQNLALRFGENVYLKAEAQFEQLAKLDDTQAGSPFVKLTVEPLQTNLGFIREIVGNDAGLPQLANDQLTLQASAEGRFNDIAGDLQLQSSVGRLLAEGSYQQLAEGGMDIDASVQGQQLQVKKLLQALGQDTLAQDFNQLTLQARLSAQQTATPTDTSFSQAKWDVKINQVDYKNYRYEGWNIEGYLTDEQVTNAISYEDSLLNLSADASLDMRQPDLAYQLDLQLPNANLFRLNLIGDSVIVQDFRLKADLKGTHPDSIVGSVRIPSAQVIKGRESYELDSLALTAGRSGNERNISLYSDYVDAAVRGEFSVDKLAKAIEDFQQYYFTSYQSPYINTDTVSTFEAGGQQLELELHVKETPLLAQALVPALNIPDTLSLEAAFNSQKKSLRVDLKAPHIDYGTNRIDSLYLYAITTERQINIDLSTNYVQAGGLNIPQFLIAGKLSGVPSEQQAEDKKRLATTELDLNVKMGEDESPYRLDLNTRVRSGNDTITVLMDNSEIVLDSAKWNFSNQGQIKYAPNHLDINRVFLKRGDQELFISTKNENNRSDLQVAIEQFEIQPFLNSIDLESYEIEGTLQGKATLEDLFQSGPITVNLNVSHLTVQDTLVGDLKLKASKAAVGDSEADLLNLLTSLGGPNGKLNIDGTYNLAEGAESPIDLSLTLDRFLLDPWQGFLEGQVNELSGELFADLAITGSPAKPNVAGTFGFGNQVVLAPTVSGARYYFEDQQLNFQGETLVLNEFTILDSARTPAVLNGTVSFADITNPVFDLSFNTTEFIFVNSESYENEAFYGRAIASADATISGPVSDLMIDGDVGVNEGTNMTIALVSEPEEVQRAGFIEFVDSNAFLKADTVSRDSLTVLDNASSEDTVSISGFALSSNIHLDPEAVFTIIVDPIRGDKITAAGEADLQVNMNPNGDLNLQGTYTLSQGQYVLNFAQVVKKEFSIREGSTITWSGDPANAEMELIAAYEVETDLEPLFQDIIKDGADAQLRQLATVDRPVFVELLINGTLTNPQLAFNLELPEISAGGLAADAINDRLNVIEQNETQLYKQVFGLIVLNRFIPISGGLGSGGGGLTSVNDQINGSVSELLTDQLSKITEEYLGGVALNVDLENSDQQQSQGSLLADRDVSVGLSKQLFDDRLTVKVGGMTTTEQQQASSGSQNIYGEFEVLYELTKSGDLMIRIFQTSNRDQVLSQILQRQGASILYKKAFNRLLKGSSSQTPLPTEPEEQPEDNPQISQDDAIQPERRRRERR
ncbi:translocation/assembly module TamB domain-containing protein [Tunicatimonas pelagia]|uniref:translocation/assembly module TamB domain-containing protein n=1 Tax=Tunicatimonas pelagia TaxID=931531 RepID=UPI00266602EF|nr:translocation/assembly module TamB domain-containing protein [Tunicatimonas pelagia]WKN46009.1 translocation/assembly module TamB domain-containing protein [Tunicatimonas pelagia]